MYQKCKSTWKNCWATFRSGEQTYAGLQAVISLKCVECPYPDFLWGTSNPSALDRSRGHDKNDVCVSLTLWVQNITSANTLSLVKSRAAQREYLWLNFVPAFDLVIPPKIKRWWRWDTCCLSLAGYKRPRWGCNWWTLSNWLFIWLYSIQHL